MPSTKDFEDDVLRLPNTVGVEYDEESDTVIALVRQKVPETHLRKQEIVENAVPKPTDVIEVGRIEAHQNGHSRKYRPVTAGTSEGPIVRNMAGTGGPLARVTDASSKRWSASAKTGELVRISNAHVYAESRTSTGIYGDVICQPARLDESRTREANKVGKLIGYVPTVDGVEVDCAARSTSDVDVPQAQGFKEVFPSDIRRDYDIKGDPLAKSGRTTGVSGADVIATTASVNVDMGDKVVLFRNQLLTGHMSEPGDSGSPVFDAEGRLTGLLFAGSDTITCVNKAASIEDELGVEFVTAEDFAEPEPEPEPDPENPPMQTLCVGGDSLFSSTEYSFAIEGDAFYSGRSTSQVGNRINGWVLRWSNSYRIKGHITDQAIPEGTALRLNGEHVRPDELVEKSKALAGVAE